MLNYLTHQLYLLFTSNPEMVIGFFYKVVSVVGSFLAFQGYKLIAQWVDKRDYNVVMETVAEAFATVEGLYVKQLKEYRKEGSEGGTKLTKEEIKKANEMFLSAIKKLLIAKGKGYLVTSSPTWFKRAAHWLAGRIHIDDETLLYMLESHIEVYKKHN